jgi:hypothetical protein
MEDTAKEPMVLIEWYDSGTFDMGSWDTKDKIVARTNISKVQTSGFLMHEEEGVVYIATTRDQSRGHYFGVQAIRASDIERRVRLVETD